MMDILRAHVESVEVVGLDEAYLDLEGLHSPRAAMRRVLADIKREVRLTCSVGIGPNKLVAKVASDAEKPAGFVVLTREQACARFAQAPPALVPGIGPKTAARLAELGFGTLAAVGSVREYDDRQEKSERSRRASHLFTRLNVRILKAEPGSPTAIRRS